MSAICFWGVTMASLLHEIRSRDLQGEKGISTSLMTCYTSRLNWSGAILSFLCIIDTWPVAFLHLVSLTHCQLSLYPTHEHENVYSGYYMEWCFGTWEHMLLIFKFWFKYISKRQKIWTQNLTRMSRHSICLQSRSTENRHFMCRV
jgi:hypothetical protein